MQVTKMSIMTLKAIFHIKSSSKIYQKIFLWVLKIACNCHCSHWPHNTTKNGNALPTGFTFYINTSFLRKLLPYHVQQAVLLVYLVSSNCSVIEKY